MSEIYASPLWSGALEDTNDITKFVQVSRVTQNLYEEAGLGGSADIFSGEYTKQDGGVTRVAIKCIRAFNLEKNAVEQLERLQKKFLRELKMWRTLSGGANIVELLGIMNGIGPLPSFVCELCPWNLQDVSGLSNSGCSLSNDILISNSILNGKRRHQGTQKWCATSGFSN
ncbi:hypothetical protein B0J17DRAFT_246589 [Rhizoctonia solani]|nr:hypothetical protein B0J17DRAFT_246589 [Rhizoctonia solani]